MNSEEFSKRLRVNKMQGSAIEATLLIRNGEDEIDSYNFKSLQFPALLALSFIISKSRRQLCTFFGGNFQIYVVCSMVRSPQNLFILLL